MKAVSVNAYIEYMKFARSSSTTTEKSGVNMKTRSSPQENSFDSVGFLM